MGLKSSPYEIFQFALYFVQGYKEGLADVQRDYRRFSSYTHSRHDTQVSFYTGIQVLPGRLRSFRYGLRICLKLQFDFKCQDRKFIKNSSDNRIPKLLSHVLHCTVKQKQINIYTYSSMLTCWILGPSLVQFRKNLGVTE